MPTQTFFNLPMEKQERIIKGAIEEFSQHSYKTASIAGIIKKADIPRGSFYQYFEDIKDVYRYVFDEIGNQKIKYLQYIVAKTDELDVFQILRELYIAGVRFTYDHPELAMIGNMFSKEEQSIRKEILGEVMEVKSKDFYKNLLIRAKEKGEIHPEADVEVTSFVLNSLNVSMVDYYLAQRKDENKLEDIDVLLNLADKTLLIIEKGIRKQ